MGMNDAMTGYKKLRNEKGYTTEELLTLMKSAAFSFGVPQRGVVAKKEAIVFEGIGDFTVYVVVSLNTIEMGRVLAGKGSGKRFVIKLAAVFLAGASAKDSAAADRALEELYDVLVQLLKTGEMEHKSGSAATATRHMNQKDKFSIFDADLNPVYYVGGYLISPNFKIEDASGNMLLEIRKKIIAAMPEYTIVKDGKEMGSLKKEITMTKPVISGKIDGKPLEMRGDLRGYHFGIKLDDVTIGAVDATRLTWGELYSIDSRDKSQQALVIAVSIIADNLWNNKNCV